MFPGAIASRDDSSLAQLKGNGDDIERSVAELIVEEIKGIGGGCPMPWVADRPNRPERLGCAPRCT